MEYSKRYIEMVNYLHAALASNKTWVRPAVWQHNPWGTFLEANPMALHTKQAVEGREDYELSPNQCSLAVSRLLQEQQ